MKERNIIARYLLPQGIFCTLDLHAAVSKFMRRGWASRDGP